MNYYSRKSPHGAKIFSEAFENADDTSAPQAHSARTCTRRRRGRGPAVERSDTADFKPHTMFDPGRGRRQ
jgi:hypothetical protein